MKLPKLLLWLLGLLIGIQYVYAGPSSFGFVFHNMDPDKTVVVWMYDSPTGGVPYNYKPKTIPYRWDSGVIFIEQDRGVYSHNGIRVDWGIQIKNKDNTVHCAIKLNYEIAQNKPCINDQWCHKITFKQYGNYKKCPHKPLKWTYLPKPMGKPKHGTRFYMMHFYIDELHTVYYMK